MVVIDFDYKYHRNESGLPFFDVMLIENLPKSASLPVATVQQTKARIMDGRWDFDYVYFTESDQVGFSMCVNALCLRYRGISIYLFTVMLFACGTDLDDESP